MESSMPQIIEIQQLRKHFVIRLNKKLRKRIGLKDEMLHLSRNSEFILTTYPVDGSTPINIEKNCLAIPEEMSQKMQLQEKMRLALVERKNGFAVKKLIVCEKAGTVAGLKEIETAYQIERQLTTNPEPAVVLAELEPKFQGKTLNYPIAEYLKGKQDFTSWYTRKLLGKPDANDEDLRQSLLNDNLELQLENGSWKNDILKTAKKLQECSLLGMALEEKPMENAVKWLMDFPRSPHNPGMFFLSPELVEKQLAVVQNRIEGKGGRFRDRRSTEIRRVREFIPTAHDPCAPRLMWPNALVLDVLLKLGYENHPRVHELLNTLRIEDWCECSYQHGLSSWRETTPMTEEQIDAFSENCKQEYRFGGCSSLEQFDHLIGHYLPRTNMTQQVDCTLFDAQLPTHIQPCESVTTRGLSAVIDPLMRKFAVAHLWRFAGTQHSPIFAFTQDGQRHTSPYYYLDLFSRYSHENIAQIVLLRILPWVISDQNEEGSWGDGDMKPTATLSVVKGLLALNEIIPGILR